MRELNPRAWSIDGECWCTRVDYDGHKKEWSGIAPIYAPDNRSKYIGEIEDTNIVLELPTGLKDKNSKEIYEGDIIREKWYDSETHTGRDRISKVEYFCDGYICWFKGRVVQLGLFPTKNIEVIGNIHENPELLEEKE
jgi:uncharacterized phage protein (TIGR01671 family)